MGAEGIGGEGRGGEWRGGEGANFTEGILMMELASIQYIHKPSHNVVCEVDDMILCDGNYGLGAYGMDSVHTREPERSRVTI